MALVLQIEQGLSVLDEADEENAKRAEEADDKHPLQKARCNRDNEIHEQDIVFDTGKVEQAENRAMAR